MEVSDSPVEQAAVEAIVGHPGTKFRALCERIQTESVRSFKVVESDFLDLLWTLDTYRVRQVVPRDMGNKKKTPSASARLGGVYRGKGNYFSTIATLILNEMTTSSLATQTKVWGFSQEHKIDIAWPARDQTPLVDPLICCEVKLTGAPAYPGNKGRRAMSDWSNRRKELKFQAADLKLFRKSGDTRIENWDLWRRKAPPSVYSLWAARLSPGDDVSKMVSEAQVLAATFSEGVGIYAFEEAKDGNAYVPTPIPSGVNARITSLDSVLSLIAAEIREIMAENKNQVPAPVVPADHPGAKSAPEQDD